MITNNQIKAMTENELAYLYFCLNSEWNSLNMPYEMDLNTMKAFKNNSIHILLEKYKANLTDENKGIIIDILNKLEANY
jgi:hypothetical protein